jgi:chemotaxis protein MotA
MHAIIGLLAVFLAVIGGFLLERGNLLVLLQPAELLIVGGAAAGIVLVANPPPVIRQMAQGAWAAFRPPARTPEVFLRHIRMLYEVFCFVQRAGASDLEPDVENPAQSRIFSNYPDFLRDHHTRDFV